MPQQCKVENCGLMPITACVVCVYENVGDKESGLLGGLCVCACVCVRMRACVCWCAARLIPCVKWFAWVPCDSSVSWNILLLSCRFASSLTSWPSPLSSSYPPSYLSLSSSTYTFVLCFLSLFLTLFLWVVWIPPCMDRLTSPGTMLMGMPCSSLLAAHK